MRVIYLIQSDEKVQPFFRAAGQDWLLGKLFQLMMPKTSTKRPGIAPHQRIQSGNLYLLLSLTYFTSIYRNKVKESARQTVLE